MSPTASPPQNSTKRETPPLPVPGHSEIQDSPTPEPQAENSQTGADQKNGQSKAEDPAKSLSQKIVDFFRLGFVGIWLIFLYGFCVFMVVFSMSARQFHEAVALSGEDLTVGKIRTIYSQWHQSKVAYDRAIKNVEYYSVDAAYYSDEVVRLEQSLAKSKSELSVAIRKLIQEAKAHGAIPETPENWILTGAADFKASEEYERLKVSPNYETLLNDFHFKFSSALLLRSEQEANEISVIKYAKLLTASQQEVRKSADGMQNAIAEGTQSGILSGLFENRSETTQRIATITELLNAYAFFQPYSSDPDFDSLFVVVKPNWLLDMPREMLTLIVVIVMGALGGTIHLTQLFLRHHKSLGSDAPKARTAHDDELGFWYFIFRPLLGCITAFAVFILTKAGVLVLSAQPGDSSSGTLSPYFVAFLGIISGLLAQVALLRIQETGTKWFASADALDQPRWAYGLHTVLEKGVSEGTMDRDDLAESLGISRNLLQEWEKEDSPISSKYQTLVAAYCRVSPRMLFTDMENRREISQMDH